MDNEKTGRKPRVLVMHTTRDGKARMNRKERRSHYATLRSKESRENAIGVKLLQNRMRRDRRKKAGFVNG